MSSSGTIDLCMIDPCMEAGVGVDYAVDLSCPVKEDLSSAGLVDLVKRRNQANTILALARQDGDQSPPSAILLRRSMPTPHGETHEDVSVQALLDESAGLRAYEHHCTGCLANVLRVPFGCYGALAYPIPASAEEWLMARLPGDLESTAGQLLRAAIEDFSYDGGTIGDMRKHTMFFVRSKPVVRTWRTGLMSRLKLTSNPMLHMMLGLGNVQAAHCGMLALFLSVIPHESPVDTVRDGTAWRQCLAESPITVDGTGQKSASGSPSQGLSLSRRLWMSLC